MCNDFLKATALPESIPIDIRQCFISTVEQILSQRDSNKYHDSIIRLNHMINSSFMVENICKKTKGINNIDLVIGTTSALFHDIFKLFNTGDIIINIKGMDVKFNISNDDLLEDNHGELGAMFVKSIFNANKISLNECHTARICEAIKVHSDKHDKEYSKTDIQKIVIEADVIEKIGLTTILKIFNNKPQLDNTLHSVLSDKYQKFTSMRDIIVNPYSIELYENRLNDFYLYIRSIILNKGIK